MHLYEIYVWNDKENYRLWDRNQWKDIEKSEMKKQIYTTAYDK